MLRRCANERCILRFLDRSRTGQRRWFRVVARARVVPSHGVACWLGCKRTPRHRVQWHGTDIATFQARRWWHDRCFAADRMRYAFVILGLILTMGLLAGIKGAQISSLMKFGQAQEAAGPPPEAVNTAIAQAQSWEETLAAVGTVAAMKGVTVSNEVPGTVARLHFESGERAKRGQLLVSLDAAVEKAQIAALRARQKYARRSLQRARALQASGTVPENELDAAESSFESISAEIASLEAQVERKTIRAPFAGRLGVRAVSLGQYLAAGTTITVLESSDVVYVDFFLPQTNLAGTRLGMPVRVFETRGDAQLAEGKIIAIDPALDAATRSFKVRAHVVDEDERLRSGMFVRAAVVLPERAQVIAVPGMAIVRASYGNSVFIVEPKKDGAGQASTGPDGQPQHIARQQFVRLGNVRGDFVAVLEGLNEGQEVVTGGAFKLRNGMPVQVKHDVKLEPELRPRPENR